MTKITLFSTAKPFRSSHANSRGFFSLFRQSTSEGKDETGRSSKARACGRIVTILAPAGLMVFTTFYRDFYESRLHDFSRPAPPAVCFRRSRISRPSKFSTHRLEIDILCGRSRPPIKFRSHARLEPRVKSKRRTKKSISVSRIISRSPPFRFSRRTFLIIRRLVTRSICFARGEMKNRSRIVAQVRRCASSRLGAVGVAVALGQGDLARRPSRNYGDTWYNAELFYIQDYSPMRDTYISLSFHPARSTFLSAPTRYTDRGARDKLSVRASRTTFQTDREKRAGSSTEMSRLARMTGKCARSVRTAEIILSNSGGVAAIFLAPFRPFFTRAQ